MNKMIDIQKDATILSNENSNLSKIIKCEIDNDIYYYKENEIFNGKTYPLNIAEVLSCHLFEAVGIENFTKYQFAQNGENSFGVISKNFIPKNNYLVKNTFECLANYIFQKKYSKPIDIKKEFNTQSINSIAKALEKKCVGMNLNSIEMIIEIAEEVCLANKINFNKEEFKNRLLEITILDYFLSNPDRNFNNVLLFVNKTTENQLEMQVGPIFDNGYCLGIRDYYVQKHHNLIPEIHNFTYLALGVSKKSQLTPYKNYNNDMFIQDLINETKQYPKLNNLINNLLNLNMPDLIKNFEEKEYFKLEPELIQFIADTYNIRVENFNKIKNGKLNIEK